MEKRGIRHPTNAMSVSRLEEKPNSGKRSLSAAEPSSSDPGNDLVSQVKETAPDDSVHHRYHSMPAVIRARRIFLGVLAKTCTNRNTERTVARFLEVTSGYYLNTDQYHNAEHAFFVGAYHVALLGKAGLLSEDRQILRASLRGLFHDSGNALHPEIRPERKGQDELRAALLLLRETNPATRRLGLWSKDGVSLMEQQENSRFTGQERLFDSACILGTVFPDRFCSEAALGREAYVGRYCEEVRRTAGAWNIEDADVQRLAASLGMEGRYSLRQGLEKIVVRCMVSKEAYALRHADLCISLTMLEGLKAHLTNRDEDKFKKNVAGETDPVHYFCCFYHFVTGASHPLLHADDLASHAFLRALQWRLNEPVSARARKEELACRPDRLRQRLVAAGLDPLQIEVLTDFTRHQGWNPEIFYGLESDVANRLGSGKLEKIDRLGKWLQSPEAIVVKLMHMALAEDQSFPLSSGSIAEIFERVRDVADRNRIAVNWEEYPLLSSPASECRRMSLASLSGRQIWQILAPHTSSGLDANELHEELELPV